MATRTNQPNESGDQKKPAARKTAANSKSAGRTPAKRATAATSKRAPASAAKPAAKTPAKPVRKSAARLEREANPKGRSTPALGKGLSKAQRALEVSERANKALKLRTMRVSWEQIARQCGYSSRGAAATAVKRELARIPREAAKELRTVELEALDAAQRAISTQILAGNFGAIDRMLKIMDARAKLSGLYEDIADTGVDEVKNVLGAWLGQVVKQVELDDLEDERESDEDVPE